MNEGFALVPEQASIQSQWVDHLTLGVLAITSIIALSILLTVLFFLARYRHTNIVNRHTTKTVHRTMEIVWIAAATVIGVAIFGWSSVIYQRLYERPTGPADVYVVGKQWMWKLQHTNGKREIDELHVPLGLKTRLVMTSQDVIHSFFIPAFRIKQDVLPGRYTSLSFTPTREGTFHLFCAEYCGTLHSGMVGAIVVMKPADFQRWLESSSGQGGSLAAQGKNLFGKLSCMTCHRAGYEARAPNLEGLFGRTVQLSDGSKIEADERYIRESILEPTKHLADGYQPIMPTFKEKINEEEMIELIEYIKSLGTSS